MAAQPRPKGGREAEALDVEIHKLSDDEIDEVWEVSAPHNNKCSPAQTCSAI